MSIFTQQYFSIKFTNVLRFYFYFDSLFITPRPLQRERAPVRRSPSLSAYCRFLRVSSWSSPQASKRDAASVAPAPTPKTGREGSERDARSARAATRKRTQDEGCFAVAKSKMAFAGIYVGCVRKWTDERGFLLNCL